MNLAASILIFGILGVAVLAVNVGYVTTFWDRFISRSAVPQLHPFEIAGLDETEANLLRLSMPRMVLACLSNIKTQTDMAIASLEEIRALRYPAGSFIADWRLAELPIPDHLITPVEIELEIAEIRLGGLVSFLVERSRRRDALNITVAFNRTENSGNQVHVFGNATGNKGYSFVLTVNDNLKEIAYRIATAIVHHSAGRRDKALGALPLADFQVLMDLLVEYARIERQRQFSAPEPNLYGNILTKLQPLADRLNRWEDLHLFAAQISEKANQWEKASTYYKNLLTLTEDWTPYHKFLKDKVAYVEEQIPDGPVGDPSGTSSEERPSDDQQIADWAESIHKLMGVEKVTGVKRNVRIAVVGGAPPPGNLVKLLGNENSNYGSKYLRSYQSELLQIMRVFSPHGQYIYAPLSTEERPGGALLSEDIASALRHFANEVDPKPHMILLTFAGAAPSDPIDEAIKAIPDDILVIVSAGDIPPIRKTGIDLQPPYKNVSEEAVVVGAAAPDRRPSSSSVWPDYGVWAPGEDIPVISASSGKLALRNGTPYAAAIVVGAIGNLMTSNSNVTPEEVRKGLMAIEQPDNDFEPRQVVNIANLQRELK